MNKLNFSAVTLALLLSLTTLAFPQKTKKKSIKKEPPKPQSMTICDGAKFPDGYVIVSQEINFDCYKQNQTGKSYLLRLEDGSGAASAEAAQNNRPPATRSQSPGNNATPDNNSPRSKGKIFERKAELDYIVDATEKMQTFLETFTNEGLTLADYTANYREIKRKVGDATSSLPTGKLRLLMESNVNILFDLGYIWENMNAKRLNFVQNRGEAEMMAQRYSIRPVQNNQGFYVISKQMFLDALSLKVSQNLGQIKQTINEEYSR